MTKSFGYLALSRAKLTAGAPELPMVRLLPILRLPAAANFRILHTTELVSYLLLRCSSCNDAYFMKRNLKSFNNNVNM